ncbi:hypothetical protein ABZ611_03215 [Streptomyces sp. NPDC007861]|uniref:hypothetical protein n=1 Tax=Streptomyces sp. NPDC007861 TaxID=3154893 RepID=UPI0033DBFFA5
MKLAPSAGHICAALALGFVVLPAAPAQADGPGPGRAIACATEALKDAIDAANAAGGGTIRLARRCTYTLTAADNTGVNGANGLPVITTPITLRAGKNTTIERSATAPAFRIFEVTGPAGALTLDGTDRDRDRDDRDDHDDRDDRKDPWNAANALLTSTGRDHGDDRDQTCRNGSGLTVQGGNSTGGGGAVFVDDDRSLTLHCVTLTDNTAANGGAISNQGTAEVRASTFSGNSAEAGRGGAVISQDGELNLTASKLSQNTAGQGGAIAVEGGSATISNSLIEHNTAGDGGGAFAANALVDFHRSTIQHNTAISLGGGLATTGGTVDLRWSSINENTARQAGGFQDQSHAVFEDSKVNGNTATGLGGGIVVILGDMTMTRSEVNENRANTGFGGGIVNSLTLTDVEVARNTANAAAGGIQNNGTVTTNGQIRITDNAPTNCTGSPNPVPDCSG